MEQPNKPSQKRPSSIAILRMTDIAFRMGITIAIGAWLGRWIDRQLGLSKPIFLLIISLLAVAGAIFMVIRDADKFGKKN